MGKRKEPSAWRVMAEEAEAVLLHLVSRVPLLKGDAMAIFCCVYGLGNAFHVLTQTGRSVTSVSEEVQEEIDQVAELLARVDDDMTVQFLAQGMPFEMVRTTVAAINQ